MGTQNENILKLDVDYPAPIVIHEKARTKALLFLNKFKTNISVAMFKFFPDPHGHLSFLPTF